MAHQLPSLPYDYNALEPHIDEDTMRLHHTKHHQTYVDKLNAALEQAPELQGKSIEEILTNFEAVPEDIKTAVRNHGGGHANHTFFWQILTPAGTSDGPSGEIANLLDAHFGGLDGFKAKFKEEAMGVFGSGWTWLVIEGNAPKIVSTPKQDSPLLSGQLPLLGLDVWEHAYYLKYQNRRPDYIDNFWPIVNWSKVEELLMQAKQ
jgi:Fe-Mn family superoxide dismutase